MKSGALIRLFSGIEQGVSSLTNFLVMVIVSRLGDAQSVAEFSLVFGLYFLNTRVHFALITMPISIQSGKAGHDIKTLTLKYVGYSFYLGTLTAIATVPLLFVVDKLWLGLHAEVEHYFLLGIIVGLLPQIETLRRLLIALNIKYAAIYTSLNGMFLLVSVYYFTTELQLSGVYVFYAYAPVLMLAIFVLLATRKFKIRYQSGFFSHCRAESSLVLHSLMQWGNGYIPIYVAAALLSSHAVAFVMLVRNMFGPLNILLLSLESYMPKLFQSQYDATGILFFRKIVFKEIMIVMILVIAISSPLIAYNEDIFGYIYGKDKYIPSGGKLFYVFFMIYSASFVSRIISIGLRVRSQGRVIAFGTGLGSLFLLLTIVPFVILFNELGLLLSMLLAEIVIATYYTRKFNEENS